MFFMILSIGGLASNNGVKLPGALATNYTLLSGNSTANTVVAGISPLQKSIKSSYLTTGNQSFISGTVGSVTVTTLIFNSLVGIWNSYILFIDGGLVVLNISTSFGNMIGAAILIGLLAVAIASAVLLFPV